MARYICKCGRVVNKSTNADNTGNRNTDGCEGCPYLLPWGPMEWNGKGFKQDIQGYECRMSPSLEYATYYQGNGTDKCVLHIYSLDYDFLERLSTWVAEQFPEKEISCSFDRSKIRATEFVGGLYCISVYPMQNKRGIAAKAALLHQFFDNNGARLDMTPEEEKAHILAAIEAGKAAQRKKENMEYIISENLKNDCIYAYATHEFWVFDGQACRWYTSGFCREQYEQAKLQRPDLTPEDFLAEDNDYNLLEDYEVTTQALNALQRAVAGKREAAPFEGTVSAPADVQCKNEDADDRGIMTDSGELLPNGSECRRHAVSRARVQEGKIQAIHVCDDQPENVKIWLNASCPAEYWVLSKAGEIEGKHIESCPYCEALLRIGCGDVLLVPFGKELDSNKPPKISDKPTSPTCTCAGCQREDCTCAGGCDAAGRADCTGVQNCAQSGCTYTVKHRANPTQAAPACPADAGAATQSLSAAAPASLAADPALAFDYTGLDDQTVADLHLAEREYAGGKKMAEMGLRRMADAVAIAHDTLCGGCDNLSQAHNNQYSKDTFGAWCDSIGVHRKAAERLLQVSKLMDNSTPREQKVLEELSPSLLYAAAKPSAPAELVQAVKDGDITTHKQFKELEAQLKAERQAREQAEQRLADAQQAHQAERESTSAMLREEQQRRQKAEEGRIAAEKDKAAARRRADLAEKERDGARQALQGTKKLQEKWREKAESAQAQLDQLQAQPIPSTAIDLDEVERRVSQRLEEERAKQSPEDQERAQQDSRDAYDAFILAARSIDNIWKTLRPQVGRLGALQGNAKNMLLQQLMTVKEELIHECENCQSGS